MFGLYAHLNGSAVGPNISSVAGIFVLEHMPVIWNLCISVLIVTLLIALGSYKVYILT